MAVGYGASSAAVAYSAQNGTSVAPAYPAGITAGQMLVLFIGMKPSTANGGTVTTPSGWTLVGSLTGAGGYGTTLGIDTGNTNVFVYTKEAVGNETGSLTVTIGTNNVSWAVISRYTKQTGYTWAAATIATGQRTTTPTTPTSVATTGTLALAAGDMAAYAHVIPTDVTTPSQFSSHTLTSTGITFGTVTEIIEPDSGTGNDIGGVLGYAAVNSGTGTNTVTWGAAITGTLTNLRGPLAVVRLREVAPPPPVASFTASITTVTQNQDNVTFTDTSTGSPTGWSWNFGTGATPATASTQGPHSVSYGTVGTSTVTMSASNGGGSDDATPINITVNAPTTQPVEYSEVPDFDQPGIADGNSSYKEILFYGCEVGDLLAVFGGSATYIGTATVRSITTINGTTSAWTTTNTTPSADSDVDSHAGWATATSTGTIRVRVTLRCGSSEMWVYGWKLQTTEFTGTPAFTVISGAEATGRIPVSISTTSTVLLGAVDWLAVDVFGATYTPANAIEHGNHFSATNYSGFAARWTDQAAGSRDYGLLNDPGNVDYALIALVIPKPGGVGLQAEVWNGTSWKTTTVEIWNGTSWRTDCEIWNGTQWVQL